MRKNIVVGLVLVGLTGMGCADKGEPSVSPASTSAQTLATSVAETPDQDTLATQAYARVQREFVAGRSASLRYPIYTLRPVGDATEQVRERARVLGLDTQTLKKTEQDVSVTGNGWELRMDARSGAEMFLDKTRFHASPGVAALPLKESDYIALARAHVRRKLPEAAAHDLRPYRVRRYMNDMTDPKGNRVGATVYQVAVAFHEQLAGLPVIGAGGKVAVHLTPAGEVISHEATVRDTAQRFAEVSGQQLLAPDDARRRAEDQLTAQGVNLADYVLTRAELGYYRLGRHGLQSVLAPHYAYFYEPASTRVVGKKRLAVIPAVTDPAVLERLRQDEREDATRKADFRSRVAPPDSK
ncbi:hypothetical protein [Archangium primigenium]|uniref:hypothetical protein n=1 Tax=[Archangium] primigenium TaxID=2792470 RepID=UPI00195C7C87|nr:hypothetical protein [Archangium primigenium]MBM7118786.1 hypothetical protein [Archangium primigenium]